MPRVRLLLVALLLSGCGQQAASDPAPEPSTTTYYCGSYTPLSPGTTTSSPPAPC